MTGSRSQHTPGIPKLGLILALLAGGFLLAACGLTFRGSGPMMPGLPASGGSQPLTNGGAIYFTGVSDQGERISYAGGPRFGMMMGGQNSCADCHGSDGRGGQHSMHMEVMDAPDIRISALAGGDDHGSSDEHGDEHADEYDLETFRQAVVLGQHPDGNPLSQDMPRWQLEEGDLADLFEFIQTLDP